VSVGIGVAVGGAGVSVGVGGTGVLVGGTDVAVAVAVGGAAVAVGATGAPGANMVGAIGPVDASTSSDATSNVRFVALSPISIRAIGAVPKPKLWDSVAIRVPFNQTSVSPAPPLTAARTMSSFQAPFVTIVVLE
jgi:hypothetical protein